MINVLVTGGRTGVEKEVVWRAMDGIGWLLPDFNLGHGAAHGVDTFVEDWCKYHGVAYTRYPIDGRLDERDHAPSKVHRACVVPSADEIEQRERFEEVLY